ncbi:MAG: hypothetical protein COU46_01955 [Candidatus Niyogibacteria bacterium CG10_big_fil_rev_8_21_14_0_10_42_19]|uniref:SHS2 domain-containing protein n=1 Tax=Candidatus Niyogibacteria bacterium CG10_big_fil_rev_8_21_14_0_10_42_19 TaxID=1974725 RepID=A0A2H0TFM5_9BACT|nr:MAG: hypothetical protein COU46_01955 [Candidatus Niyogibacteria bacterium CG10_big_fil_rev_8_21_14_0_10_42_19]
MFWGKTKKRDTRLAINIGTGSVTGLLYHPLLMGESDGDQKNVAEHPEVIKVLTLPKSFSSPPDLSNISRSIKNGIKELRGLVDDNLHISGITVILSSPWFFSQTRTINMERPDAFEVNRELVKNILDEEKDLFVHGARGRSVVSPVDDPEIIEISIMRTLLNGYEVEKFFGKKTISAVFSVYLSLSLKDMILRTQDQLHDAFHTDNIIFHSFPYIFFRAAKHIFDTSRGFTIVDVGGEITDVTIIRDGVIEETFSFGKGINFIIRRLSSAFNISPEEALSILNLAHRGEFADSAKDMKMKVINSAIDEWSNYFSEIVKQATSHKFLPSKLIFIGEGARFSFFNQIFKNEDFKEKIYKAQNFQPQTISPKVLRNYIRGEGKLFAGDADTTGLFLSTLHYDVGIHD